MESNPSSDSIILAGSKIWYWWRVSQISSGFFGTAIVADLEMSDLVEQREGLFFQAGILFGVGIPAAMTDALELLREIRDRAGRS